MSLSRRVIIGASIAVVVGLVVYGSLRHTIPTSPTGSSSIPLQHRPTSSPSQESVLEWNQQIERTRSGTDAILSSEGKVFTDISAALNGQIEFGKAIEERDVERARRVVRQHEKDFEKMFNIQIDRARRIRALPVPASLSDDEQKLASKYREALAHAMEIEAKQWRGLIYFGKTGDLKGYLTILNKTNSLREERAKAQQAFLRGFGIAQ